MSTPTGPGALRELGGSGTAPTMLATNPLGAAAALRGRAQRPDYRPLLASLDTSSFVCVGDDDTFSSAAVTDELTGCLREPDVAVLTGVGHLHYLEWPGDFNEHLLGFLGRTRSEAGQ